MNSLDVLSCLCFFVSFSLACGRCNAFSDIRSVIVETVFLSDKMNKTSPCLYQVCLFEEFLLERFFLVFIL